MESLIKVSVVGLILATALLCFTALMEVEQATAQNVQSVYLSIHGGAQ
jgi:hypothetical protein